VLHAMRRERRRLERGHTYEPPTFYDTEPRFVASAAAFQ
jgi:hypothetical protein